MKRICGIGMYIGIGFVLCLALTTPWEAGAQGGVSDVPGDVNGSGAVEIGDPIYLLEYIFNFGPAPASCPPCDGGQLLATGQTESYRDGDDGFYHGDCSTGGAGRGGT